MSFPPPTIHDRDGLHRALGEGLARWQYVETALFLLAASLMETDPKTCSLAFFQIKSAQNKLTFVDRLISHKMSQESRKEIWKPLLKDCKNAIDFRNQLAHFEIFDLTDEEMERMEPPTANKCVIAAHHLDEHAHRAGYVKVLAIEVIEGNSVALRDLSYALVYFMLDHAPPSERLTKSLRLGTRQWLDSFRKNTRPPGFAPPPESSRA